jgi:hypothetical protein
MTMIPPGHKCLFKALCIKLLDKEGFWPRLRPLVVYEFYYDSSGHLSVYAESKNEKQPKHGLFWINIKESNIPCMFDEYFIKIEEEK